MPFRATLWVIAGSMLVTVAVVAGTYLTVDQFDRVAFLGQWITQPATRVAAVARPDPMGDLAAFVVVFTAGYIAFATVALVARKFASGGLLAIPAFAATALVTYYVLVDGRTCVGGDHVGPCDRVYYSSTFEPMVAGLTIVGTFPLVYVATLAIVTVTRRLERLSPPQA